MPNQPSSAVVTLILTILSWDSSQKPQKSFIRSWDKIPFAAKLCPRSGKAQTNPSWDTVKNNKAKKNLPASFPKLPIKILLHSLILSVDQILPAAAEWSAP
jgi:hypothetical protein